MMSDDLSIYTKTSVECTTFPVYMDSMVQFYDIQIFTVYWIDIDISIYSRTEVDSYMHTDFEGI